MKRYHRYCGFYLPRQPIPAGRYLVHNQVQPVPTLCLNGFRAWVQEGRTDPELVECFCDFGRCKNADLHEHHYRVAGVAESYGVVFDDDGRESHSIR